MPKSPHAAGTGFCDTEHAIGVLFYRDAAGHINNLRNLRNLRNAIKRSMKLRISLKLELEKRNRFLKIILRNSPPEITSCFLISVS